MLTSIVYVFTYYSYINLFMRLLCIYYVFIDSFICLLI